MRIVVFEEIKAKRGTLYLKISTRTRTLFHSTDIAIDHDQTDLRAATKRRVTRGAVLIEHTIEFPIALPAVRGRPIVRATEDICALGKLQNRSLCDGHEREIYTMFYFRDRGSILCRQSHLNFVRPSHE